MKNVAIALLDQIGPDRFEETEIKSDKGITLGHHSVLILPGEIALGGGLAKNLNISRRIAVAESLERTTVDRLKLSKASCFEWHLDSFPTTCGFAAGFEREPTRMRSYCEAVERWAWSQWIDYGFDLEETTPKSLSNLTQVLLHPFEKVKFFVKKIKVSIVPSRALYFGVVIGERGKGVFPGSRVCSDPENIWLHAAVEARRHFLVTSHDKVPNDNLFFRRVRFFSQNNEEAFRQIKKALKPNWCDPEVLAHKIQKRDGFYLARTLMKGYLPWHVGGIDRFVY